MTHLCLIAPIGLHPRFVRLTRAEASARVRAIDHDIRAHEHAGRHAVAIQARADRHDLDVALRELCAFRRSA